MRRGSYFGRTANGIGLSSGPAHAILQNRTSCRPALSRRGYRCVRNPAKSVPPYLILDTVWHAFKTEQLGLVTYALAFTLREAPTLTLSPFERVTRAHGKVAR